MCNKCLYESSKIKNESSVSALFTPLITKDLKRKYDQAYLQYKESRCEVAEIETEHIKEIMVNRVKDFCKELQEQVNRCEEIIKQRIKDSASLKTLELLVEQNADLFSENQGSNFQKIKDEFDSKINNSKYATIVKRQNFYRESIFTEIEKSITHMDKTFESLKDLHHRVIQVQEISQELIIEKFDQIIEDTVMNDVSSQDAFVNKSEPDVQIMGTNCDQQLNLDEGDQFQIRNCQLDMSECSQFSLFSGSSNLQNCAWTNMKELVTDQQKLFSIQNFTLKQYDQNNRVWESVLKSDLFYQRIVVLPGTNEVYLVGGAQDYESEYTTNEVILYRSKEEFQQKKSMIFKKSKVCLTVGQLKSNENVNFSKAFIFAIGGQENKNQLSRIVERYSPRADLWQQMPSLIQARSESSAIVLNDNLYVFGGMAFDESKLQFIPIRTIERLNLKILFNQTAHQSQKQFQVIDIKLPTDCINVGLIPISNCETLILGGFSYDRYLNQKLKFSSYQTNNSNQVDQCIELIGDSKLDHGDFFQAQIFTQVVQSNKKGDSDKMEIEDSLRFCNYDETLLAIGTFYTHQIELFDDFNIKSFELKNL
ncbi:macronuclear development protein 3 [Stylonychia lemnae]|uniref:Macronuclear development protein 3 n=1 Tax=Stylonychia lemnae TaxID=5949 RepID=A0A078B827_STYLE|nr:macronuclear development protein 3 [Stylonychia lemnae]|eukprot:CDW90665.1 macronuclear development protein 3 [Stylonychia lemnae]